MAEQQIKTALVLELKQFLDGLGKAGAEAKSFLGGLHPALAPFNQEMAKTAPVLLQNTKSFGQAKMGINQLGFALGDASVMAVDFWMV